LNWIQADLSWLETRLTHEDMADVLTFVRRRVQKRRDAAGLPPE
jgi:hypothetical protein